MLLCIGATPYGLSTEIADNTASNAAVGNPKVAVFSPGKDGPTVIPSRDGEPVPYIIPRPLVGGGETPYDTNVTIDTKPGTSYKPGDTVKLPPGNHTVTYTVTDATGNTNSSSMVVTIGMHLHFIRS
jgi:hypothetical protein